MVDLVRIDQRVKLLEALLPKAEVDRSVDYGFTVGFKYKDKAYIISEVWREDRDGYVGYKLITLEHLRELIKRLKDDSTN